MRAIESFEVPALLGLPVGIQVFTSSIYQAVHRYPSQIGLASAYAMTLLAITTVGVYCRVAALQPRIEVRDDDRQGLPAAADRPRAAGAGSTTAIFVVYFLLIVVLPFLVLLWSSFQKFYSVPSLEALQHLTLDPYRFILSYPEPRAHGVEQPAARRSAAPRSSCW